MSPDYWPSNLGHLSNIVLWLQSLVDSSLSDLCQLIMVPLISAYWLQSIQPPLLNYIPSDLYHPKNDPLNLSRPTLLNLLHLTTIPSTTIAHQLWSLWLCSILPLSLDNDPLDLNWSTPIPSMSIEQLWVITHQNFKDIF